MILCGTSGVDCALVNIGQSGAIGVPYVVALTSSIYQGADVYCDAFESCKNTVIEAKYLQRGQCDGQFGCQNSQIVVAPAEGMRFQCTGQQSCEGATITITINADAPISMIEYIEFSGDRSAQRAVITIRNLSPNTVLVEKLECGPGSCLGAQFIIEGNILFDQCDFAGQSLPGAPPVIQACIAGLPQQPQIASVNNQSPSWVI